MPNPEPYDIYNYLKEEEKILPIPKPEPYKFDSDILPKPKPEPYKFDSDILPTPNSDYHGYHYSESNIKPQPKKKPSPHSFYYSDEKSSPQPVRPHPEPYHHYDHKVFI